jgi:Ran GTPase-activating protein (RanGAP) involved in mRNA processing and transport
MILSRQKTFKCASGIHDEGAKKLADALCSSKLEILQLGENLIADLGANAFANALKENTTY